MPGPTGKSKALFVSEYLVDFDANAAAVRSGFGKTSGSRLLADPWVHAEIQRKLKERAHRADITGEMVIQELAKIAFGDLRKVVSWGPDGVILKDSETLHDDDACTVAEVEEKTTMQGRNLKLKRHDKVKALELLGKHLGLFVDKQEISGPNGAPLFAQPIIKLVKPGERQAD